MNPIQLIWALISGALFGFGLSLSTMTHPEVVLSFLRFTDFGLLMVLGGAVIVAIHCLCGMRYVELVDIICAKISICGSTTEGPHEIHCYTSCHVQGMAI